MIRWMIVFSVSVIFSGCGATKGTTYSDNAAVATSNNSSNSSDGSKASSGCSQDGSETLVPGTYIFALSSSVSSKQKTQVKILKSDCKYCFETVTEGDTTALSLDGTWASKLGTKNASGQQIDVTAGGVVYTLSGDGQILSQSSSVWSKSVNSTYTCN